MEEIDPVKTTRPRRRAGLLMVFGPGLIVAATGIGAGDLATAGFAGSKLGLAVMWAVVLGAAFKFVLNEGIARWQLATGTTLLEGGLTRLGPVAPVIFLIYLLPWTYVVCAALISACGVTVRAMLPDLIDDPGSAKVIFGGAHSLIGVAVAWLGGFKLFERIMAACIGVMFIAVSVTAVLIGPDLTGVAQGLFMPRIPDGGGEGLTWTIALMGGVGGTLTILCYGYWIREEHRTTTDDLRTCRIDLAAGYTVTALFGLAMLIIAQGIELDGKGAGLIALLADRLGETAGQVGRWVFLIGAWAAVFSSLLGVWQSVPYIFADFCRTVRPRGSAPGAPVSTRSLPYRGFLIALAIIPIVHVYQPFESVQKAYAVIGALFIPLLAVVLLILNGRRAWMGASANRPWTIVALAAILAFFAAAGVLSLI